MLSHVSADTQILIQDSLFMNNVAGSFRLHKNLPGDDSVQVDDDHISLNTSCCVGTMRSDEYKFFLLYLLWADTYTCPIVGPLVPPPCFGFLVTSLQGFKARVGSTLTMRSDNS